MELPPWVLEERELAAGRERLDATALKRKRAEEKLSFATQADRRGDYRQSERLLKEAVELYPCESITQLSTLFICRSFCSFLLLSPFPIVAS